MESDVIMYGVLVGKTSKAVKRGELLTVGNLHHQAAPFHEQAEEYSWTPPDVSDWKQRRFMGYHRTDGQVGTRNYWLVVPLVFCENRNIANLQQAFEEELGFAPPQVYRQQVTALAKLYREGRSGRDRRAARTEAHVGIRRRTDSSSMSTAFGFCCTKAAAVGPGKIPIIFAA